MLTVKNNNLTLTRGESGQFIYNGITKDGIPLILPPKIDPVDTPVGLRKDYAVLAFTVRTAPLGDIVIEKYFDLEAPPMYDGVTDYTPGGYRKFTSIAVEPYVASQALAEAEQGIFKVYNDNGTFVHIIKNRNDELVKAKYEFKLSLPIEHDDTANLKVKQYVYDLIIYYGSLTDAEIASMTGDKPNYDFPIREVFVKHTIVDTHEFNVEDSNNV